MVGEFEFKSKNGGQLWRLGSIGRFTPHLWTKKFFQDIGEACGGLEDIDQSTASFGFLLEAKIKLKTNFTGFIPEVVEVANGDHVFRVRIRQLSPAKRPTPPAKDGEDRNFLLSL